MPGIVISRRTSGSSSACSAMIRSTRASSSPRKSSWRRHASSVRRSSMGSSCSANHARPLTPKGSLAGGRRLRLRCSTAAVSFLIWVRRLTSPRRRETSRRIIRVRSSPIHTAGMRSAASRSARTFASTLSVLTFAWLIARTSLAWARTTSATCGSRMRAIASALPVASSTTRSSGPRLRANSASCAGSVPTRPAERARPPSAIATWQKSRCASNPIDLPTLHLLLDDGREDGGHHDTYGFALAAHPGKSQGRPVTPTGSRPIASDRPAHPRSPRSPCPGTGGDATRRRGRPDRGLRGRIFMPVHHETRLDYLNPDRTARSRPGRRC